VGAETLVRGATRLARSLGVDALVIGLTVVALGTSFPELFVSIVAAHGGDSGVALGNVIGSNIFNVAVILAIGALIQPVRVEVRLLRLEIPFVLLITMLFAVVCMDGSIGRADATLLLSLFVGYMGYVRHSVVSGHVPGSREAGASPGTRPTPSRVAGMALLVTVIGLATLVFGARWLVEAAERVARMWGVSERVIGLTLVAGGTSLPELASTLVAFFRKESDLAVGTLLGSNIFNTLAILGTAGMVRPLGPTHDFMQIDMLVLLLTVLLLVPLARSGWRVGRLEGALLLVVYAGYMTIVATSRI